MGLSGPLNDVETIAAALGQRGFSITRCCGADATRAGIIGSWRSVINRSKHGDAIVIYYSGHGGLVEQQEDRESDEDVASDQDGASDENRRMQFILPVDYHESTDDDFRGILDIELTYLLRDTTEKTKNVTVILDCCHSGRMARHAGHGATASPKRIAEVQHHDLKRHIQRLRACGQLRGETSLFGNMNAVRIMAAAAMETAWEYRSTHGTWNGALTHALARALNEAHGSQSGHEVSWRTTLFRVRELVNQQFPEQHPHVEGQDTRLPFSIEETTPGLLEVRIEDGEAVLQGGRVAGVREGNVYCLMPSGYEKIDSRFSLGTATVSTVTGFYAGLQLQLAPSTTLQDQTAVAFLQREALPKWPVMFPSNLKGMRERLTQSPFLRPYEAGDADTALAVVQQRGNGSVLYTRSGIEIASKPGLHELSPAAECSDIVMAAEQLARAQHLLNLNLQTGEVPLEHHLDVRVGLVENGEAKGSIDHDGKAILFEHDLLYISLSNKGAATVYVWVFDVNCAGSVTLITAQRPYGVELDLRQSEILGKLQFGKLRGLKLSWPDRIPKSQNVPEQLVMIITNSRVDLRRLAHLRELPKRNCGPPSSLEQLVACAAGGGARNLATENNIPSILYDVVHVPFSLVPRHSNPVLYKQLDLTIRESKIETKPPLHVPDIPTPEVVPTSEELPCYPPWITEKWEVLNREQGTDETGAGEWGVGRGAIAAGYRAMRNIPPCVWVVNLHTEQITAIVSKYRPNRILSGGGVSLSTNGAGFELNTMTFDSPATKKVLCPYHYDPQRSIAVFPLWTRKEGFGVISIFTFPDQRLYIENDKVPIGATAIFTNQPNLQIVRYGEMPTEMRETLGIGTV
ncbi:caspase domain-containing protein [Aspergillus terricola var. indicus]